MNACPAVVLLIFNRPDCTRRVFERVRAARPETLFVVADGPRADAAGEAAACEAARAVVAQGVDWPCDIRREFSDRNLGCARRVSSGLDWVFAQVEEAIVLEDDCVPDERFFPYCTELLARYRAEPRVGLIAGSNFQARDVTDGRGYYFSRYPHCWGWATWRRAWRAYDHAMTDWPAAKREGWLGTRCETRREARYWERILDRVAAGEIDSWAYRWTYACWRHDFLTALPARSLVTNIGFDRAATHTRRMPSGAVETAWAQPWPLVHPPELVRHAAADRYTYLHLFHPTLWIRLRRQIARRLGRR
jgi:hypothetical protein